jgi:hypothetical protein
MVIAADLYVSISVASKRLCVHSLGEARAQVCSRKVHAGVYLDRGRKGGEYGLGNFAHMQRRRPSTLERSVCWLRRASISTAGLEAVRLAAGAPPLFAFGRAVLALVRCLSRCVRQTAHKRNASTTFDRQALSVDLVRAVGLEEVQLARAHERLGAALHIELAVDVVDVALDRADSDNQPVGDRLIGMTVGD